MMDLSPHTDLPGHKLTCNESALLPLRVGYEAVSLESALAESDVLAVIGFGRLAPAVHDPRYLRVGLEPQALPAPLEIWRGRGPVKRGVEGAIRWASDADYTFAAIELDERAHDGLANAARSAYEALGAWCSASRSRHVLRIWNYIDAINEGDGDNERYRLFCAGRAAGMAGLFNKGYPAATAIGLRDGRRVLQMYWLCARRAGMPVENPRQLSSWRYPRRYGPAAPNFARAMRAPAHPAQIYISGTAAIIGHASHHADSSTAQFEETLTNLDSLLTAASIASSAHFGARSAWKVYVRRAQDAPLLQALLRERLGADTPLLLLRGDICRAELLVEIDGVQNS
ncbi:MAG: pteridine-dependent deoxygenase [Rudaea sp.]|nr:pteridine-dependent deoxygenase [Rudaea sp.]